MINYFYNITLPSIDDTNLNIDILSAVRRDYHLSREPQKGRFTKDSEQNCIYYDYSLEKDRSLKWKAYDDRNVICESLSIDSDKYCVCYYDGVALTKRIIFSKFHTLLKVEYFNSLRGAEPYCIVEPRKGNNGLCLLLSRSDLIQPVILYPMPSVTDEFTLKKIEEEYTDYTALAYTNEGIVRYLSNEQLELFDSFCDKCLALKLTKDEPESFIDESEALLAKKLNPKDFNVKRNLSQSVDISLSDSFSPDIDSIIKDEITPDLPFAEPIDFSASAAPDNSDIKKEDEASIESSLEIAVDVDKTLSDFLKEAQEADHDNVSNDASSYEDEATNDDESIESSIISKDETNETSDSKDLSEAREIPHMLTSRFEPEKTVETPSLSDTNEPKEELRLELKEEPKEEPKAQDIKDTEPLDQFELSSYDSPDLTIKSLDNTYLYYGDTVSGVRQGYGRTADSDGNTTYEGYYFDNKRNGLGTYFYKDRTLCYYGEWLDNNRSGFGIGVSSVDKSIHIGNFKNNKPDGNGVRLNENGEINFVKKQLSDGTTVLVRFVKDELVISRYNENGDRISDTVTNLTDFSDLL